MVKSESDRSTSVEQARLSSRPPFASFVSMISDVGSRLAANSGSGEIIDTKGEARPNIMPAPQDYLDNIGSTYDRYGSPPFDLGGG